ncbi:4-(cytidine 5'-diphospho)-2-C-methyl-D-erythritol kinase [Aquibium oceanicum]|uniref:4-diphosphocytidyl-2-C-methyl-D-erythritol kinase n=1 Tax=Aquibium oceanicum TaxID=1670800 RepID=A0A1L3SP45_9HYPH|nr:4-(cytidine 5'-diphospho)-2-C-methyl-D-erythritol kinase [Aquibium oceanicum]APH71174.1 4-(cytidine 5'-diphospho)-2-C-methyl-D-erythritol kinase [Aquibium oceanicum]
MPPVPFSLCAPAKINLALHVTGRRADGYHLLETLAVFCELGDRLEFRAARKDAFAITGRFGAGLSDDDNLVLRARDRLRQKTGAARCPPVSILLEKNLPVASGMGGGSSDAAATLRGLSRLWDLHLSNPALTELGAALGADVPMCLAAHPLVAWGIGEKLAPLEDWPALDMVLVNPAMAVSTPDVFRRLESRENPPLGVPPRQADYRAACFWLAGTRNDLEAPARSIVPEIGQALDALREAGAGFARMTGSGATCFGLFSGPRAAGQAAAGIRDRHPDWFVEPTRTMGAPA